MLPKNDVASSATLMAPWDVLTCTCARVASSCYLIFRRLLGVLYIYIYTHHLHIYIILLLVKQFFLFILKRVVS